LVAHISAGSGNLGQIVCKCFFFTVVRRIDFLAAYQQLLIVGYGQCTATIQAQDALRARWQHQAGQVDETEELFHCIYTL